MQTGRYQKYIVAPMMSESPKAYAYIALAAVWIS